MCGLVGFLGGTDWSGDQEVLLRRMSKALTHRGPDDEGCWFDDEQRIGLGHRRLSIIDLSLAGHQPMVSSSGRYVIAFNGEIYNHIDLRGEIREENSQTQNWRGNSDTETLLAGFEQWGIERTLKKSVGMFAIALWDRKDRVLTLARDRMGEKPLYYGFQNDTLLFGSELKALKAHPDFLNEIDRDVICLYLRHCYIPAPYSIYKRIKKLLPGTYLQIPIGSNRSVHKSVAAKQYWNLSEVTAQGLASPFIGSDSDAIGALDDQLRQSIGLQMIADVPLGAFLSGGVDSSTIVALMQAQSDRPVKTFSIGFIGQGFNEAEYASGVAKHLGTDHTELYVTSSQAPQVIPMLGKIYDEPFADSSQIPTFLVSQMAKQHVTVSLSGDGGDELFGGYSSSILVDKWPQIEKVPYRFRKMVGNLLNNIAPSTRDSFFKLLGHITTLPGDMSEKLSYLANRLANVRDFGELCYSYISVIDDPEEVVIGAKEPPTWLTEEGMKGPFKNAKLQTLFVAAMAYLPDDILVKVDRAAMANSLETRIPLLDHRVVEMAFTIPMSLKVRDGKNKWLLRQVLNQYVPGQLIDRPKSGFSIPLNDWLRGPLREWVEDLLGEDRLRIEGFFNVEYIRKKWHLHLLGGRNYGPFLWSVLMFQVWLDEQ